MKVRYLFNTDRGTAVMDEFNSGFIVKKGLVSDQTLGWQTIDNDPENVLAKLPTYTAEIVGAYNKLLPRLREEIWREGLVDFDVVLNFQIKKKG